MSKYTRLNKINHYHDSGSRSRAATDLSMRMPVANRIASPAFRPQNRAPTSKLAVESAAKGNSRYKRDVGRIRSSSNLLSGARGPASSNKIATSNSSSPNLKIAFFASLSLLLVLLVWVDGVRSLNCYHCSSVDNPECDEAFSGKANITETDCEKHIGRPAKVCRKIVQYIEDKKVVIRSCGFIEEHEGKEKKSMCYKRSGTFAIMMESCNCYTDNCNHSASLVPHQSVLLLLTSCSVLFYLIHQHYFYDSIIGKVR